MKIRKLHRLIGLVLLLPFLGWVITGFVFFIKPGYAAAYEILTPKTYPLTETFSVQPESTWREMRYVRTILGNHLLVRTSEGALHLDPRTRQQRNKPTDVEVRQLITDALLVNPTRYGEITTISADEITTSTGIQVSLDWTRLSLQQRGPDTDRIDWLYRIHYLQWTGFKSVDKVLGLVGLTFVFVLTTLGAVLFFRRTA
jgi:uncharacterized iron-regulated membrane protein